MPRYILRYNVTLIFHTAAAKGFIIRIKYLNISSRCWHTNPIAMAHFRSKVANSNNIILAVISFANK